jgi:hypothetical protein
MKTGRDTATRSDWEAKWNNRPTHRYQQRSRLRLHFISQSSDCATADHSQRLDGDTEEGTAPGSGLRMSLRVDG